MLGLNHNQNRIIALAQPKPDFESARKHVSPNVIEVLKVELTHQDDVLGSRTAPACVYVQTTAKDGVGLGGA